MNLEEMRSKLDIIDKEMATLFNKRMQVITEISNYKRKNKIKVRDVKRESFVINSNLSYVNKEYQEYYEEFIEKVIALSRKYQYKLGNDNANK